MKIRLFYQGFSCLYAIAFLVSSPTGASECRPESTDTRPSLEHASERLIDALTGAIRDRDERLDILHDAATEDEPPSATYAMLAQRALLTVAGEFLRAGRFDQGRDLLRTVPLDSPVAVEAALLLADSWRMEGQPAKARDWYLRAGSHFPRELLALQGMLAAAHTLEDHSPEAAAALYDRVHHLARRSADRLARVPDGRQSPGPGWLLSTDNDLSPALHRQLAHRVLSRGEESMTALGRRKAGNQSSLRCLLRQAEKVRTARTMLSHRQQEMAGTLAALEHRIGNREERIAELRGQVEADRLDENQIAIRKSLVATQNELKRLRGEALFLRQNMERLPAMLNRLTERLNGLHETYRRDNEALETTMDTRFSEALASLRRDFMNLAGASQDGKARLIESMARAR